MKCGIQLETDLFRQINPKEAESLDSMMAAWWPPIFAIGILCLVGAQLPFWMFINSLSLIVHTILLNSMMPPAVSYVFKKYLYLRRLHWHQLDEELQVSNDEREYTDEQGLYSIYLKSSGYLHLMTRNMSIIIWFAVLVTAVWILASILDRLVNAKKIDPRISSFKMLKNRNEPYMNNFMVRLFYEFFFEVCICAFINIGLFDFEKIQPTVSYILSTVAIIVVFVYTLWLISLLFCLGPYLEGFYQSGSYFGSFWSARPFNENFNATEKNNLLKQKRKKII